MNKIKIRRCILATLSISCLFIGAVIENWIIIIIGFFFMIIDMGNSLQEIYDEKKGDSND